MGKRCPVAFVAWGAVAGRSAEIAHALGGDSRCFFPPSSRWRPPALLRYALGPLLTWAYLARRDPRIVIVTNPPVFAGCSAWAWARLRGADMVLDSHPGSFGRQGDRLAKRLLRLHVWLARRAALSLVTSQELVDEVQTWGGRAMILHEAPGAWTLSPPSSSSRPRVLFVSRFARDEPVGAVVEAARRLPQVDVAITGDPAAAPPGLVASAPPTVSFVGFLPPDEYRRQVMQASLVMTLTTEPTSVMRVAYEAVYAGRPLVVSDWPLQRDLFPTAVYVGHDPTEIAAGIESASRRLPQLSDSAPTAREAQLQRWNTQIAELRSRLEIDSPAIPYSTATPDGELC